MYNLGAYGFRRSETTCEQSPKIKLDSCINQGRDTHPTTKISTNHRRAEFRGRRVDIQRYRIGQSHSEIVKCFSKPDLLWGKMWGDIQRSLKNDSQSMV